MKTGEAHTHRAGWWIAAPGIALVAVAIALVMVWRSRPHLTDENVDGLITAAIQQEARAAFLVTGYLDLTGQARVENTLRLLPGLLDLPVGSTTAEVRAPGRATYGFNVSVFTADNIAVAEDGTVEVIVPQPQLYNVAPDLERIEIETKVGWTRVSGDSREAVQARALALVQQSMEQQAATHLRTSEQPGINSADALYDMLRPVLVAAGMKDPRFRFRIGEALVLEPRDR